VIAGLASIGMPGFSGFWAEMQVLVGAWMVNPWWTVAAGVGIVWALPTSGARCKKFLQRSAAKRARA